MIKILLLNIFTTFCVFTYGMSRPELIDTTRRLNSQKKFQQAQNLYLNYLKDHPRDVEIMFMLANTYSWNEQYGQANFYFKKASSIKKDYLPAHLGPIKILSWQEKYDQALKELTKLGKKFKKNPSIYNYKGKIYSWKKNIRKSLAYYRASYKLDPNNEETLQGLAKLYRWLGMNNKHLSILNRLMKKNPQEPEYLYYAALAHRNLKNIEQAIKYLRRAKKLPGADQARLDAEILFTRTLMQQNRQDKIQLKKNVALDKSDVEEFIKQGRIYSWNKKNKRAIALFRRALKKSPRHIDALLGLGNTYYFGGEWDNALSVFKRADRIKPGDPEIERHIEKIRKLQRPVVSTQYRNFTFDDKIKTSLLNYTQKTKLNRYSLIYKQSLNSKFDLRGEAHYETLSNKDSDFSLYNYQVKAQNIALETNYRFVNQFNWRLKLFRNQYENINETDNVYLIAGKENHFSGYTLLRKEWGKHYFSFSIAREYLLTTRAADLSIAFYEFTALDLFDSVEFSEQFTTTFGIRKSSVKETNRDYYVYSIKPLYRPKQLKNWEISLEYKSQEETEAPDFSTTTFFLSWFRNFNNFFFDFTTSLAYTNLDESYAHNTELTFRYKFPARIVLSTELSYLYEFDGDEDKATSVLVNLGRAF